MIRGESLYMYGEKSILALIMFGRRQALHPGPWIRKNKEACHKKKGTRTAVFVLREIRLSSPRRLIEAQVSVGVGTLLHAMSTTEQRVCALYWYVDK